MRFTLPCAFALLAASAAPALAKDPPSRMDTVVQVQMSGGRLGAQLQNLTDDLRTFFGASTDAGVLVAKVEADSPAAKAGLKAGDVIVDIDGTKIEDPGDAIGALQKREKGATATIQVVRDKKRVTLKAALRDGGPMAWSWSGNGGPGADFDFDFDPHAFVGPAMKGMHGMKVFGDVDGMQKKIDALEGRLKDLEQKLEALAKKK